MMTTSHAKRIFVHYAHRRDRGTARRSSPVTCCAVAALSLSHMRRCARMTATLAQLSRDIITCRRCSRLVKCRELAAREPPRRFAEADYWAKPLPGFGDREARLLVVGLAPAAHGGNRTGRVFTGDRSGDWLYAALHRAGVANQATSRERGDGLELHDAYVTTVVRCAPPANKPSPTERDRCLLFLVRELAALARVQAIVALGAFAWDGSLRALRELGHALPSPRPAFGHAARARVGPYALFGSYHVSQQNTFTGRLTEPMLDAVFAAALKELAARSSR
jgi:uracil-DNA glycosylase family 4